MLPRNSEFRRLRPAEHIERAAGEIEVDDHVLLADNEAVPPNTVENQRGLPPRARICFLRLVHAATAVPPCPRLPA